jgi:hypothetical protein
MTHWVDFQRVQNLMLQRNEHHETNTFIEHQTQRNELAHWIAETLDLKPRQKYFHEGVYYSKSFVRMSTGLVY